MSKLADEMRTRLTDYLYGRCLLVDFESWLASAVVAAQKLNDQEAQSLGTAIEWAFSDLERGASPAEAKQSLSQLAARPILVGKDSYDFALSGTSSNFQEGAAVVLWAWEQLRRSPEMVHA
jgi:hypothetical protein